MTGAERLEQVREALRFSLDTGTVERYAALDALDGCILLTAEEAAEVALTIQTLASPGNVGKSLALLTPEGSDDAEDDPYPDNPGPFGTNPGEC